MYKNITSLGEVDFEASSKVCFTGTILEIVSEGLEDSRRPIRVKIKLESSGDIVVGVSWFYSKLESFKSAKNSANVFVFNCIANQNKGISQMKIESFEDTGTQSARKIVRSSLNVDSVKAEMASIAKRVNNPILSLLINELIFNSEKFFAWPAATKVHHAYPGGLAFHSLNVCKNAITIWENTHGENLNLELLIAGSLLHDIGKLSEYNSDGSRTIYGKLIPHAVSGVEAISSILRNHNIPNQDSNPIIVNLKHIILSHHEKLEFNAAVTPGIMEAVVVARADALDALLENLNETVSNLNTGEISDKMLAAEGFRILKWQ